MSSEEKKVFITSSDDSTQKKRKVEDDEDDNAPLKRKEVPEGSEHAAKKSKPSSTLSDDEDSAPSKTVKTEPSSSKPQKMEDDSDDDKPLKPKTASKAAGAGAGKEDTKPLKVKQDPHLDDDSDDDDKPLKPKKSTSATPSKTSSSTPASKKAAKDDSDDDKPLKKVAKKIPPPSSSSVKKSVVDSDDEDDKPLQKVNKTSEKKPSSTPAKSSSSSKPSSSSSKPSSSSSKPAPSSSKAKGKTPTKKVASKESESSESESDGSDSSSDSSSESEEEFDDEDEEEKSTKKKKKAATKAKKKEDKKKAKKKGDKKSESKSSGRGKKKEEEEEDIYRWWLEEELPEGQKWRTLEHKGPLFPPPYTPLPPHVKFLYDGKPFRLTLEAEEVAGFYAAMLESDYTKKTIFNKNFFKSWREVMTKEEKDTIKDLGKCNFSQIHQYFSEQRELRKSATKEEKQAKKAKEQELVKEYGYALLDGHREKVGNFRIEPPGLFRGRGEHPKQGLLKRRVFPHQVTINIGKGAKIPPAPEGGKWAAVQHDNTVSWLASWIENVNASNKYVTFNPESRTKGRNDMKKYETARGLKKIIGDIRKHYREEWTDRDLQKQQRAVCLYLIDKLALRAGGEKDTDEEADTVGCCSLRVEHVALDENNQITFDFLGKDSIRYVNTVTIEPQVYKCLQSFKKGKKEGDSIFDLVDPSVLNRYLQTIMDGLTAKVFRTYNASITLQEQLKNTPEKGSVDEKMLAYNRANRDVAVLCNHQRAAPKTFDQQVEKMDELLKEVDEQLSQARKDLKAAKKDGDEKKKEALKKTITRLEEKLEKKKIAKTDKMENKTIALSNSKLNYLDPRISVAWCKRYGVPIEKVYNKTQRSKFRWAIEMAGPDFVF